MSEDERQTYVDVDCWQLEDGRTFVGNRAVEYVPLAEVERLREELHRERNARGLEQLDVVRDPYIRAFNRLEKAVTNHINQYCIDSDGLAHVHKAVMRDLATGSKPGSK